MAKPISCREAIPVETLKALVAFDAATNRLFWKERPVHLFASRRGAATWNSRFAGKEAFVTLINGYFGARIFGRCYYKHRAVWAFVYGEWPVHNIDHVNGDRTDNRIENLRDVPQAYNMRNAALPKTNSSGAIGVGWYGPRRKWTARIKVNKRNIHLGYFTTFSDAVEARKAAERQHGFLPGHGRGAA